MRVIGNEQAFFGFGAGVEGVHLGEGPIQSMFEVLKTAHAVEGGFSGEISLQDQSLRGFADIGNALKVAQFKVFKFELLELKGKVVVIADLFMNDETDVKAKGFFRLGMGRKG